MSARRLALLLALVVTAVAHGARADTAARFLFVPVVGTGEALPGWSAAAADQLGRALAERGVAAFAGDAAAAELERHSTAPAAVGPDDVRTLQRLADYAMRSVAAQDMKTALQQLDGAARMVAHAPDAYNQLAPRLVLDLCLFRARALLESGALAPSVKQAIRECRMRIPLEIEPEMLKHTNATVRQLLSDVTSELHGERNGLLRVAGPDGCVVRIDGVDAGSLRSGTFSARVLSGEHRVSLVCAGVETRSHSVLVGERGPVLRIDPAFDAALRSDGLVWLSSADGAAAELFGGALAAQLGVALVLVARAPEGGVVLQRVGSDVRAALPYPAYAGEPWSADAVRRAVDALLAPDDPARAEAAPAAPPVPRALPAHRLFPATGALRLRRAAIGLGAAGAAASLVSIALHARAKGLRSHEGGAYAAAVSPEGNGPRAHASGRLDLGSALSAAVADVGIGAGISAWLASRTDAGKPTLALSLASAALGGALVGLGAWQRAAGEDACAACAVERADRAGLSTILVTEGSAFVVAPLVHALAVQLPVWLFKRKSRGPRAALGPSARALALKWSY